MKWVTAVIKDTEVNIAFDENSIHVYNAFLIKDDLKLRGYRWNPNDKSWFSKPGSVDTEISALQNNLEKTKPVPVPDQGGELAKFPASCSVVELRNRIDQLIREGLRGQIWVRGIIASEMKNYQWFSYFDLKDEDENRNIYFNVEIKKNDLDMLNRKLKDSGIADSLEKDLPVFCLVEVHLSLRSAVDIRLRILDILPEYTQAKIRNQREITLDKLEKEGILKNQKNLKLPVLISRVGLITSEQGTSIRDIMAGLGVSAKRYDFYFVDTRMEGVNAVASVTGAIDFLEKQQELQLDAILLARGGGSEQSLAVFNDYRLCRGICRCTIPVLTAIGHEKDISAAEICSFVTPTPATPSGLGKYLHERFADLQQQLSGAVGDLIHYFEKLHNKEMEKIKSFVKNIPIYMRRFFKWRQERFSTLVRRFEQSVGFTVRDREKQVKHLLNQVLALSAALRKREEKQIAKTMVRIDFQKRVNATDMLAADIRRLLQSVLRQSQRVFVDKETRLQNLIDLIKAGDPDNILKKGFTLTLDEEGRIIKTLQEFEKKESARLRFHDGAVKIKKEEES